LVKNAAHAVHSWIKVLRSRIDLIDSVSSTNKPTPQSISVAAKDLLTGCWTGAVKPT